MAVYVAKRLRFRNGERISVLQVVNGLPVHEVTLYLGKYRTKGRMPNTLHGICRCLALLYRLLDSAKINLLARLAEGRFLTIPELERIASAAQYWVADLDDDGDEDSSTKSNVIHISRIGFRRKETVEQLEPVDIKYQATRLRYIADFLDYIANYVGATLEDDAKRQRLVTDKSYALTVFRAHIPKVPKRAKLDARVGLSEEEQNRVLEVVHPNSPQNPWARKFSPAAKHM